MSGGQGRLKPAPGSLFVTSKPSLRATAISLLAWLRNGGGCVVLDQPQRVARSKVLRLVFDTAAFRPRTGRFENTTAHLQASAFAMTWPETSVRRSSRP